MLSMSLVACTLYWEGEGGGVATPSARKKVGADPLPSDPTNASRLQFMIEHQRIMTTSQ